MISHVVPKVYTGQRPIDYDIGLTYDYHLGEVVHSIENCKVLRHHIQDLIDHEVLKFGGIPDISTNSLPKHLKGNASVIQNEEDDRINLTSIQVP
jgi:hypothetical protein